jgi:WhiB family transcriptional regulator, redox-sensing transcriptional regulator
VLCTPDGLTWPAWRWPRHAPGGPSEEADVPGGSRHLEVRLGRWMDRAACQGMVTSADEDIFFAPDLDELGGNRGAATRVAATRESLALAVCDRCPVQLECLAYAVTTRQQHGVWGGKTQQELRRLVANTDRPKRRPPLDVGVRSGPRPGSRGRCPAGHPYEEANTYRYGSRQVCRTCQLARVRARRLAGPTHCPQGHAYDQTNTVYDARGRRRCRACLGAGRSIRARRRVEGGGSDAA